MSLGYVGEHPAVYFGENDVAIMSTSDRDKVWVGLKLSQLKYPMDSIPCDEDLEEGCSSLYMLFRSTESLDKIQRALDKVRDKLVSWELERKGISDDYCNGCDIKR